MEKKRLTISAGILSETTRTPSRPDRAALALCGIGSCLFLDGLTPPGIFRSSPGRRDTAIAIRPESGRPGSGRLPGWRRGSSRDPEKQIPITNWTD